MQLLEERKPDRARSRIHYLVKTGKLIPSPICEQCGKVKQTRAHHDDYDKPLEVRWLCGTCHGLLECPAHKPKKRGRCEDGRGNRKKTERNQKIYEYWLKGYRQIAIARMYKMKPSAVSMVIRREKQRREVEE